MSVAIAETITLSEQVHTYRMSNATDRAVVSQY
jgi:hypothetical protein